MKELYLSCYFLHNFINIGVSFNKNLLLSIVALVALSFSAQALEPITVVFPNSNNAEITCELVDYENTGEVETIYSKNLGELKVNSSGIILFTIGANDENWENISASDVTSYYIVNLKIDGNVKAQFRLDELINASARTANFSSFTSSEFEDSDELGDLTSNIVVYTGEGDIELDKNNFSDDIPNNSLVIVVNNSSDDSNIDFLFPPENTVTVRPREFITLLKVGGNFYFQLQPTAFFQP